MIDMVIHCPRCGDQHIDEPDPKIGWTNPPHKSHLCLSCGVVWRVADIDTNGVAATQTQGKADNWFPPLALAVGVIVHVDPVAVLAAVQEGACPGLECDTCTCPDCDGPAAITGVGGIAVLDIDAEPDDETNEEYEAVTADVDDHGHDLRIEGDEYVCNKCGKRWGFDDLEIPGCS